GVGAFEPRQRADQPEQVGGLEVVRLGRQGLQVADAGVRDGGPEQVGLGDSGQRGPAAGAVAADGQPARVGEALLDQRPGGGDDVFDVHHAPLAAQPFPVGAAVAAGAAVVDVDDADAAAGEVGPFQVEGAGGAGG